MPAPYDPMLSVVQVKYPKLNTTIFSGSHRSLSISIFWYSIKDEGKFWISLLEKAGDLGIRCRRLDCLSGGVEFSLSAALCFALNWPGGGKCSRSRRDNNDGASLRYDLEIDFKDAVYGCKKDIYADTYFCIRGHCRFVPVFFIRAVYEYDAGRLTGGGGQLLLPLQL